MTLNAYLIVSLFTLFDILFGVAIGVLIPHSVKKLARTQPKAPVTQKLNTVPTPLRTV